MAKRSWLNVHNSGFTYEHRYINLAKASQRVIQNQNGHAYDAAWYLNINDNQYPTEATVGLTHTYYFPEAGTYVARWTGSGSMSFGSGGSPTNSSSGVYTGGGSNGSVVTNGRFTFTIGSGRTSSCTIKGTTIDNVVVCLLSEEAAYDGGQVYRTQYVNRIVDGGWRGLRFMDHQSINTTYLSDPDDNPPLTAYTYAADTYRHARKAGLVTGTNDFIAPAYASMPVALTHGEHFIGHVENSNDSTTCTLDSGSRGVKSLVKFYEAYPGSITETGTNNQVRLIAGGPYSFLYDGYWDKWFFWPIATSLGSPIEDAVRLCNTCGVEGWFCIPYYATDAWITWFANYLDANYLASSVNIEPGNEWWNSALGFRHYNMAKRAGNVLMGLTGSSLSDVLGAQGYFHNRIEAIMRPILGSKLKMVLAGQGSQGDSSLTGSAIETRLFKNETTATSGTIGTPADNLSGTNAPITKTDVVSYARYYDHPRFGWLDSTWNTAYNNPPDGVTGIDDVLSYADDWATGDATLRTTALNYLYDQLIASAASTAFYKTGGRFENWNTLAASYSKMVEHYEANQEYMYPTAAWCTGKSIDTSYGAVDGKIDNLIDGWLNSTQYETYVMAWLTAFYALSQSQSASLFSMTTQDPWRTFPKISGTSTDGGDSTQEPFGNWRGHSKKNAGYTRFRIVTT